MLWQPSFVPRKYARHQQSLQEKAPHGTLTPGLQSTICTVCAARFLLAHCGGCRFFKIWLRQLYLIHCPMVIITIFFAAYCAERESVPECRTVQRNTVLPPTSPRPPINLSAGRKKAHVKGMFTVMLFK